MSLVPNMPAFVEASARATAPYHHVNLGCVPYLQALKAFIIANGPTYQVTDYAFVRVRDPNGPMMGYATYKAGNAAITTNGKHYVARVHGLMFHNHDPYGIEMALFAAKQIPFNRTPPIFEVLTWPDVDALGADQQR